MKIRIRQFNCIEGNKADYRQARAVLKYQPNVIIFEYPETNGKSDSLFNNFRPDMKPKEKVEEIIGGLQKAAKDFPYALSDVKTWQNIQQLWAKNHDVSLYSVDAPNDLRSEFFEVWNHMYPCATKNWLWWVQIYLRERIMASHISNIFEKHRSDDQLNVLIFLQSFHWQHVQFLLKEPTSGQIWDYYFGKFEGITPQNIGPKIKANNKVFYSYWTKYSDFGVSSIG